jgi:tetratricopeptide (TPR) repeat protein
MLPGLPAQTRKRAGTRSRCAAMCLPARQLRARPNRPAPPRSSGPRPPDAPSRPAVLPPTQSVLALAPDDTDALRCKLVALINLKRFAEALEVCGKTPAIAAVCAFEKAYVDYRLYRNAEALEVIEAAAPKTGVDVRMDLLRAQVLYRLGRYHESGEVYGSLEDEETDPGELAVNRSAAMSEAGEAEEAENVLKGTAAMLGETGDMAYNRACAVIARGDMTRALLVLDQAEQLHRQVPCPCLWCAERPLMVRACVRARVQRRDRCGACAGK